ncbi:MAG: hypothetical protein ACRENE_17355 [Polyangiaceae bacterium]
MNPKTRIRFDAIDPARRALTALPEFKAEQITKAHAVQLLATEIRAAQAKGYSMEAIAKVLGEQNVAIPLGSLRAYLAEGVAKGRGKARARKPRGTEQSKRAPDTATIAKQPNPAATPSARPSASAAKPSPPAAPSAEDAGWEASTPGENKAAPAPRGFHVRPDTRDI